MRVPVHAHTRFSQLPLSLSKALLEDHSLLLGLCFILRVGSGSRGKGTEQNSEKSRKCPILRSAGKPLRCLEKTSKKELKQEAWGRHLDEWLKHEFCYQMTWIPI